MPTFKTAPDPDSTARSPYDDLNRMDRNDDRNSDRSVARADERNAADLRTQDRLERGLDSNGRQATGIRTSARSGATIARPNCQRRRFNKHHGRARMALTR